MHRCHRNAREPTMQLVQKDGQRKWQHKANTYRDRRLPPTKSVSIQSSSLSDEVADACALPGRCSALLFSPCCLALAPSSPPVCEHMSSNEMRGLVWGEGGGRGKSVSIQSSSRSEVAAACVLPGRCSALLFSACCVALAPSLSPVYGSSEEEMDWVVLGLYTSSLAGQKSRANRTGTGEAQ